MLLCVNSQHLIFSLYLSLSFPSSSHCFPSLSFFFSSPLCAPPCPYFFLPSFLTPSCPCLPSFPSLHLITLLTLRWRGQQAPGAVCVALHHGSACWRPLCLCLFFFSPPSPFSLSLSFSVLPSSAPPHVLSPAPPASPSLLHVGPVTFVLSLGQPPWALSLISSRCVWVLLQSAPSFLLLSSFIFPLLPFVFPAPSGLL